MAHGTGDIDKESKTCMECHDGTLSSDAGARTSGLKQQQLGAPHRCGDACRQPHAGDFKLARRVDTIRLLRGWWDAAHASGWYFKRDLAIGHQQPGKCPVHELSYPVMRAVSYL